MVRYEYLDQMSDWIRYKYYPENKDSWGIVSVKIATGEAAIDTLAPTDTVNRIKTEGIGYVTISSYAGHAIQNILDKMKKGEVPENGVAAWY